MKRELQSALKKILFIFIIMIPPLAADPWGKDAELARISHRISSQLKKDVASDSFSNVLRHCLIDKTETFEGEDGVTDCPRSCEKCGLIKPKPYIVSNKQNPLVKFAKVMIKFHQNNISKTDGPRSHYVPSSSQYTLDAIQKYGFFYGFLLGCDRLMRENNDPWIYPTLNGKYNKLKHDPIK